MGHPGLSYISILLKFTILPLDDRPALAHVVIIGPAVTVMPMQPPPLLYSVTVPSNYSSIPPSHAMAIATPYVPPLIPPPTHVFTITSLLILKPGGVGGDSHHLL